MGKSSLQQLIDETSVDPQLAKSMLIFTGGDVEGAKMILSTFEKNIGCLLIKFSLQSTKAYGLSIILFNLNQAKLEKFYCTVSENQEISSIDLLKDVKEIKQVINYTPNNPEFAYISTALETKISSPQYLEKLINACKTKSTESLYEYLINFFGAILNEITTESNIIFKFRYETMDPFAMGKIISDAIKDENEKDTSTQSDNQKDSNIQAQTASIGYIVLECEPIYSPIKGIDVSLLQEGDYIKVKISDDREIAQYLGRLLEASEDNNQYINAKINSKEMLDENLFKIIVEFGPGILGKIICGIDVKIEADISGERVEKAKQKSMQIKGKGTKKKSLGINAILIIIAGLIIIFMVMMVLMTI